MAGDINDAGQFVLSVTHNAAAQAHYFDLDEPNNDQQLSGMPDMQAYSLNSDSPNPTIVGVGGEDFFPNPMVTRGFRLTLGGTLEVLDADPPISLDPWEYHVWAYAVADSDWNSGRWAKDPFSGCSWECPHNPALTCGSPARWDDVADYEAMDPLWPYATYSLHAVPFAINNAEPDEQFAGWGDAPGDPCQRVALFWEHEGAAAIALPQLDSLLENRMEAYDISDPDAHENLWVVGRDIDDVRAVVWRGIYDQGQGAHTWYAYDLNDSIDTACTDPQVVTDLGNKPLRFAVAVNNAGWIVARSGFNSNNSARSYVLIPTTYGCPGDINFDGVVDVSDLLMLLSLWGDCDSTPSGCFIDCPADLNCDGVVDVSDLLTLLANWGPCPGFPDPGQVVTLEEAITDAGLTMDDWSDFVDVMTGSDEQAKTNWNCWMQNYLMQCVVCPSCPGADPFR